MGLGKRAGLPPDQHTWPLSMSSLRPGLGGVTARNSATSSPRSVTPTRPPSRTSRT